jgi:hypothetical protein
MASPFEMQRGACRASVFRRGLELILILLLALTVLVQANAGTRPLGRDQGFYVYIGNEIVHGRLPYADAWEDKPPAIFYLNALGIWLARGSRWGVWVLELVSLVLASWLSYEFMRRRWGILPALFGTALWLYSLDRTLYGGGDFTEEFALPVHFLAIILMVELPKTPRKRLYCFAIGMLFSFTFLLRANNAAPEAAVVLTMLVAWISRRQYREIVTGLAWMAVGAAIPLLLTGLYFWSKGLFQEMIDASLLYDLRYEGASSPSLAVLWTGFQVLGVGVAFAVLGYLLMLYDVRKPSEDRLLWIFFLIGWPLAILVADPANKGFAHYYISWLPFVGCLGTFALSSLQARFSRSPIIPDRVQFVSITLALALTIAVLVLSGRAGEYGRVLGRFQNRDKQGIELRTATAVYAQNHTKPGDFVLFWSAWPGENYMADRESPTASLYYPLYARSDISTRLSDRFFHDLVENKPVLIVDIGHLNTLSLDPSERQKRIEAGVGSQDLPENILQVLQYIDQHYHKVAVVKGKTVYRLNGAD